MSSVERQHLQRKAYVSVRQSTMAQGERNVESRERQYELVGPAVELMTAQDIRNALAAYCERIIDSGH